MEILSLVSIPAYVDIALLILTAIFFFIVSGQKSNDYQQSLFKVLLFSVLSFAGFAFRRISLSTGTLIIAQKLIFFSGSLLFFFVFQAFLVLCHIEIPKWVNVVLKIWAAILTMVMITFDFHHLVYNNFGNFYELIELDANGFYYYNKAGHTGPFLWVYRANDLFYTIATLALAIISSKKVRSKRLHKQNGILFSVAFISVFSYFIDLGLSAFGIDFDAYVIGHFIGILMLMYLVFGSKIYDLNDTVHKESFEGSKSGIISISYAHEYQGANPLAKSFFRGLNTISYNEEITEKNVPDLYDFIIGEETEIHYEDRIYELSISDYPERELSVLWFDDVTGQREYIELLKNYQNELEEEVKEKTEHIRQMQDKIMIGMSDIIENRDGSTGGHVKRTSYIVDILLAAMLEDNYPGVTKDFCEVVSRSAPMHDLGKIAISDAILQKPGKLDDDEFTVMKSHSAKGAEMVDTVLEGIEENDIISITENIARSHHEKWNGMGYPDNLKEEEIPLEARVMAIADVYDALVSKRCYKPPMPFEKAYEIMDESFGSHFDPNLKKYFDKCRDKIEDYYKEN